MAVQIVIQANDAGQVNVNGPLENKLLMYGLLDIARDIVRDYKPPLIQQAREVPRTPPVNGQKPGDNPPLRRI